MELQGLIEQWLKWDQNPKTRQEIIRLQQDGNWDELQIRLGSRIAFGTAGLRSSMHAGFSRMNTLTVLQASQGLAKYLKDNSTGDLSVVIGHDHRYNSVDFAEVTAIAFLVAGFKVYYLDQVPTPLVPFTIGQLDAKGGIMVTASHNPKDDNGYKVYMGNGCQIIPPHDSGIAKCIEENLEPHPRAWDLSVIAEAESSGQLVRVGDDMIHKYVAQVKSKLVKALGIKVPFVYTPMHGVGHAVFDRIAFAMGIESYGTVGAQVKPDPAFPTVSFPNPEEKGALDLAMKQADELNVELVIANDPDADRFSVAVKVNGTWRQLTGNEIGFLFANHLLSKYKGEKLAMINSTVSSQLLKSVADTEGFHYEDTLTGFKWLGNRAIQLEEDGFTVPFAFEEAIGYMFSVVHDKDGLSAAAVFLQMANEWYLSGVNALEILEAGYKKYGYFKECNGYYIVNNVSKIFSAIRSTYDKYPDHVGVFQVETWRDLTVGYQSNTNDNVPDLPVDASSEMITATFKFDDDRHVRFTIRGSGTEPKLKVYIEAKANNEETATSLAKQVWDTLKAEWFMDI